MKKSIIGWREWVALPELGVERIKAKIDTGARTSALHAFDLSTYKKGGQDWVRFTIQPYQKQGSEKRIVTCPIREIRMVTNSGGIREQRFVIETRLTYGDQSWPIEITLTNRKQMGFRMLLGRTAIKGRYIVDPGRSYCFEGSKTAFHRLPHQPQVHTQEEE